MEPSIEELKQAFNRSKLGRMGYSFQQAMQSELLSTQLKRLANVLRKQNPVKQQTLF